MPLPLSPPWRLHLHGSAKVVGAGGESVPLERKLAGIVAYLHRQGPTSRARIAALLWPAADAAGARANLRQRLARLRAACGPLVIEPEGVLALAPDVSFEPPDSARETLLAGGDYADCDEFSGWLEQQREAVQAEHRRDLVGRVRADAQAGRLDAARDLADELLALDRESEESYRLLMEVHYMRGDAAAAIAVWDRCRDMLRGIYGVLPSAATRQLGETILQAARAGAAIAPSGAAIPLSVLRPPRLVARAAPLAALQGAWRSGHAVGVLGEGGIGKSRLLAELAAAIGPSAVASARAGDALLPFASLTRLTQAAFDRFEPLLTDAAGIWLPRLLPALTLPASRIATATEAAPRRPLRTPHEQALATLALREVLLGCVARGCAIFVFDDLHLADRASIETLANLLDPPGDGVESAAVTPRFAFGSRADELSETGAELLERLTSRRRGFVVTLEPLAAAQAVELLDSLGIADLDASDLAGRLVRRIGGNPAYLLESIKLLLSLGSAGTPPGELPLPPGIEAVIGRRIELLSAPARHIAQLAAIAGASYSVPLVAAALAQRPLELTEPLRELEVRQVLYGRQFVHELVASAVLRSIPRSIADFMHRFVAEYLEAHGGEPGPTASHWRACGEWRRAGDRFIDAARLDERAARPVEQCEMLDAAADCYEQAGAADELFRALVQRLQAHTAPDRAARRLPLIERLESMAASEEQRLHALSNRLAWRSEQLQDRSTESAADGLARAKAIGHRQLCFEFAQVLSWQHSLRGEHDLSLQAIEGLREGPGAGDPALDARLHLMLSLAHGNADQLAQAIDASRLAVAGLRACGDELRALAPLSNMGLFLLWRGELAAAEAVLLEARSLRERFHGRGASLVIDVNLGAVLRERGDYAAARAVLEPVVAELRAVAAASGDGNTDAVVAENHLATLWLLLGDTKRAAALLGSDASGIDARYAGRRAALSLRMARATGVDLSAPIAQLQALVAQQSSAFNRAWLELDLVDTLADAEAMSLLERLLAEHAVRERPGLHMHAALRLAERMSAAGRAGEAVALLEAVLTGLGTTTPFDIATNRVWQIAAGVFTAAGRPERAEDARRAIERP